MARSVISQRVEAVKSLSGRFRMVPQEEVRTHAKELRSVLSDVRPKAASDIQTFDARDAELFEVVNWVIAQGLANEPVKVFWLSQEEGILLDLQDFLKHFEELWFPGSDDVVIESQSKRFLLAIDHEEQVRLILFDHG